MKSYAISLLCLVSLLCGCASLTKNQSDGQSSDHPYSVAGLPQPEIVKTEREITSEDIIEKAVKLLKVGDYKGLDKYAETLVKKEQIYISGVWSMDSFGYGICHVDSKDDANLVGERVKQLEAWAKASPESPYALTAVAEGYADYAWEARGGGYSDTVTQEGGKLFEKRLAVARQWLEKAGPKRKSYPRWYSAASTIALGEGWDAEKFDATMDEGIKLFPTYYTLHFDRVYHLQPRWYGKEGDWEAYAAKAADQIGGEDGDMLYARIIWYVNRKRVLYKKNTIFSKSNVSWVRTARGFDLLAAKYNDAPDVLNAYARLAVAASDVEKAKKLFAKIGAEVTMEPWATTESNARNYFLKCRMWAFGKQ